MKTLISIITLSLGLLCFAESRTVVELRDSDTVITKESNGSAKMLPKYLWTKDFYDSYTNDAAWYYSQPQDYGHCSAMRDGDFLYRNLDWRFDHAADVIVRMFAGEGRFASVGVANCGTNLTEEIIASGVPSRYFKCLPGRTVDGINENGVCAEVNVVDGDVSSWTGRVVHCMGVVRWALDHGTNAEQTAKFLAANIYFPQGWTQNFHWMIADATDTYIVENGEAHKVTGKAIMTNFRLYSGDRNGEGKERYDILDDGGSIKDVWFTKCYSRSTNPPWMSEFGYNYEDLNAALNAWDRDGATKESHRGEHIGNKWWWQTVHTSIYDLKNMTLKIAVQEQDDWYVIQMPNVGGSKIEVDTTLSQSGKAADAKATGDALAGKVATNLIQSLRGKQDLKIYIYGEGSRLSSDCLPVTLDGDVVDFNIGRTGYGEYDFPTLVINGDVFGTFTNEGVYDGGYDGLLFNGKQAVVGKYPYLDPTSVINLPIDRIARMSDIPSISATSLQTMLIDANSNTNADCECIKTNICKLIKDDVESIANEEIDNNVAPWAKTGSPQPLTSKPQYTPAEVGAYPNASGVSLAQSVQVLGLHLQAEDARVTVTNYNSSTKDPSMYLEYKVTEGAEAGAWKIVWNELTRWNKLLDDILPNNYYNKSQVDSMVNNIPWGTWDSQTGGYAPDKTISMSADRVILCKGASYQRTVTAQGSYFVWTANQPYEVSGIESNGFFRIEDAEGNVTFEIVKGDKVTAAANPDGLYTEQVMGITHLHIHYPIEADVHPELDICDNLTTHDWKLESDDSCIANVTWTGTSGNYYAEVWGKTSKAQIFVKGTYQKGSDPYVRYASALDVQQLRIGGVIYNVGTATISGHTVLTLTPAN